MNSILDLPLELLVRILFLIDVTTALDVCLTCRRFLEAGQQKTLWVAICRDLQGRNVLPELFTPDLATLSTPELIALLRRLVTGPSSWSTPDSEEPLAHANELRVRVPIPPTRDAYTNAARLLPSGRYVLFKNNKRLQCWDTRIARLVWTLNSAVVRGDVEEFAAEELDGRLRVLVCLKARRESPVPGVFVEVVEVDLVKRQQTRLMLARPTYETEGHQFRSPSILGPIGAVVAGEDRIFLLNWERNAHLFIDGTDEYDYAGMMSNTKPSIALLPGYIVFTCPSRSSKGGDGLVLAAHSALERFWCKLPQGYDALRDTNGYEPEGVLARKIPPACILNREAVDVAPPTASGSGSGRGRGRGRARGVRNAAGGSQKKTRTSFDCLSVSPNPLRDNTYRVWVRAVENRSRGAFDFDDLDDFDCRWEDVEEMLENRRAVRGEPEAYMVAYDVELPAGAPGRKVGVGKAKRGAKVAADDSFEVRVVAFSGHVVTREGEVLTPDGEVVFLDVEEHEFDAGTAGMLVFATKREIVIRSYL
ncbi:F-box domain-containing protein [Mycena kentingensis (nom. inval.)]|nr:F-box domain-containing protein [Mycena kentingensis (nom. inval.)]